MVSLKCLGFFAVPGLILFPLSRKSHVFSAFDTVTYCSSFSPVARLSLIRQLKPQNYIIIITAQKINTLLLLFADPLPTKLKKSAGCRLRLEYYPVTNSLTSCRVVFFSLLVNVPHTVSSSKGISLFIQIRK